MTQSEVRELIPLHALGALDEAATREVERYLRNASHEEQREAAEFREVAALLPFALLSPRVRPELKGQLFERINASFDANLTPAQPAWAVQKVGRLSTLKSWLSPERLWSPNFAQWLAVASSLLLAAASTLLFWQNRQLKQERAELAKQLNAAQQDIAWMQAPATRVIALQGQAAPQASAKWQATDWLYFRGTIGKTFANVVQPPNDPPVTFLSNAAIAGGSVGTTALPYINKVVPNFDVSPETGLNYSYGAAVKKGPFEAKIDYYSIEIDNLARPAISAANILAGSTTNGLATDSSPVNCDSPLINTLLTQATGAGAAATCSPAAHSGGGPATVTVAQFFTGANRGVIQNYPLPRSVNSGTLSTEGIDVSLAYRVEDVIPGTLQLNLDVTKVLSWNMSDLLLNGALISRGYDGVGFINAGNPQKNGGQLVSEYKAAAGFNYTVGRHNLNWRTTWRSALTVDAPLATTLKTAVNANVGTNAFIANCGTSATGFTAGPNTVIPGAGLAVWGATLGACATDATTISGGTETLPDYFNSDLSYRVTLPWQTTFTATVQNVFDVDPGFYRAADSYSSFLESPLGRTVRVGLEKKF